MAVANECSTCLHMGIYKAGCELGLPIFRIQKTNPRKIRARCEGWEKDTRVPLRESMSTMQITMEVGDGINKVLADTVGGGE